MAATDIMCPYCGEMIPEKAAVCRYCGRMLTGERDTTERTGEAAAKMRRRSHGLVWLIAILVAVFLIGIVAAFTVLMIRELPPETELGPWADNPVSAAEELEENIRTGLPATPDEESEIEAFAEKYVSAFQQGDAAVAALFPQAILDVYDGDPNAVIAELDENRDHYGAAVREWSLLTTAPVGPDDVAELEDALGIDIDRAVAAEVLITPDAAPDDPIDTALLLVKIGGAWYLYYAY